MTFIPSLRFTLGRMLALCVCVVGTTLAAQSPAEPPRLAVVISVDQLRYDYLDRFVAHFGEGGFNRLRAGGADFQDCHYRHAITKTAPGHATILSGVHADVHGIVGNDWVDRTTFKPLVAVEDPQSPLVGAAPRPGRSPGGVFEAREGRSPRNFLATTVGDQLKLRFGAASRVVSVANKDRAAILMGGRFGDAVYWTSRGRFVTSRYYGDALPEWVEAFNREGRVEAQFGHEWTRALPAEAYSFLGDDDAPGEQDSYGLGVTLPKRVDGGSGEIGNAFYEAINASPFASELVAAFAKAAVRAEGLGTRPHAGPDLLCIGFSQIDHTGHLYGPDSHEIFDSLVRLDRVLADLLEFLDTQIGLERCVIVLTADHGACPLPERVAAMGRGVPAERLEWHARDKAAQAALDAAFGPLKTAPYWTAADGMGMHLNPAALAERGITSEQAQTVIKAALLQRPEVRAVYTRAELMGATPLDAIGEAMRRSFHPARSPDVFYVPPPYFIDRTGGGTTHGTPYNYDTHVPLLWFGAGVPAGAHPERVGVDDLAPTLAGLLRLNPPPDARGRRLF